MAPRYTRARVPAAPAGGSFPTPSITSRRISHEQGFFILQPPPPHAKRAARFLKLLPIAALLAAPQAWAINTNGIEHPSDSDWFIGCVGGDGSTTPCGGSKNKGVVFDDNSGGYDYVAGGYSDTWGDPAKVDNTGTADDNELTVEAVSVRKAYGGYVEGFFSKGTQANFNTLTIKGTDTDSVRFAYGGYSERGPVAKENKVFIDGASVGHAYGGYILYDGDATDNTVTLTSGSVEDMTAGFAYGSGNATRNKAFINGGTVITEVSGGYAEEGNATGNTVTLAGGEVKGSVWGGECKLPSGTCDAVTGNTLNVQTKGMKVGGDVANFDTLSFDLDTIGAGDTVLDVGGTADFSKVSSAKFSFKLADGAALKPGDTITLIKAGDLQIPSLPTSVTVCGHDFELLTTATTLTATVKEPAPTPNPTPTPQPYYYGGGDSSSPTLGELGLLLSGLALAGAAAPALRRREKLGKKD